MSQNSDIKKILMELLSFNTCNDGTTKTGETINLLHKISEYFPKEFVDCDIQEYSFQKDGSETFKNRGNLIVTPKKATGPKILLQGHIDTVVGYINPVIEEDFVVGRGAVDMKGAVSGLIYTFLQLLGRQKDIEFTPVLLLTSDEEANNFAGIKHFIREDFSDVFKFGICAEPTSNTVKTNLFGAMYIRVITKGESGHSSSVGTNAIELMNEVINKINTLKTKLDQRNVFNYGVINGGSRVNVIPEKCLLKISIRNIEEVDYIFKELGNSILGPNVNLELVFGYNPIKVQLPSELKQFEAKQTNVEDTYMVGITEATFLNQAGIPTVIMGPGDIQLAHVTPEKEKINLKEIEKYCSQLISIFAK